MHQFAMSTTYLPYMDKYVPICYEYVCTYHVWTNTHQFATSTYILTTWPFATNTYILTIYIDKHVPICESTYVLIKHVAFCNEYVQFLSQICTYQLILL